MTEAEPRSDGASFSSRALRQENRPPLGIMHNLPVLSDLFSRAFRQRCVTLQQSIVCFTLILDAISACSFSAGSCPTVEAMTITSGHSFTRSRRAFACRGLRFQGTGTHLFCQLYRPTYDLTTSWAGSNYSAQQAAARWYHQPVDDSSELMRSHLAGCHIDGRATHVPKG
jgi:hypothetical protein